MISRCHGHTGCVDAYMAANGPECWGAKEIRRNCEQEWQGKKCDDCGVQFCHLSPMRPSRVVIRGKDFVLCAACQKPYSVHRAHWTYNTYWAQEERKQAELNHEHMHELRVRYDENIARMTPNDETPF